MSLIAFSDPNPVNGSAIMALSNTQKGPWPSSLTPFTKPRKAFLTVHKAKERESLDKMRRAVEKKLRTHKECPELDLMS